MLIHEPHLFPGLDAPGAPANLARRSDPATSKEAAVSAATFIECHETAILTALLAMGERGGTKDEIAKATGLDDVAVARRMAQLRRLKKVEQAGTRELTSGRKGTAWRLAAGTNEEVA